MLAAGALSSNVRQLEITQAKKDLWSGACCELAQISFSYSFGNGRKLGVEATQRPAQAQESPLPVTPQPRVEEAKPAPDATPTPKGQRASVRSEPARDLSNHHLARIRTLNPPVANRFISNGIFFSSIFIRGSFMTLAFTLFRWAFDR